ncbi:hypothetical protein DQY79_07060 [Salmonella enterica subsp. enterica serovar Virchow]|nr:hypothetical protein [Salmonella enterica subsp. enterica serovar Virchow]
MPGKSLSTWILVSVHWKNCLDNAAIESFFGTLNAECYYLNEYKSVEELKRHIISYIDYYNNLRIKEKLGGLSPIEYRLRQAA